MRRAFDEELRNLHYQFSQMGLMVSEAVYKSVKAFINHDKELAKDIIINDPHINNQQVIVETKSIELIALQQPVSSDLRRIVTVMKACADLERMGDHAVDIAKATILVKGKKRNFEIEEDLAIMADKVKDMVEAVLSAYIDSDVDSAKQIAASDNAIDLIAFDIHEKTLEEMRKDVEIVFGATHYILVARNLERISDYVTNICEWIVYLKTGEITELNTHNTLENVKK